MSGMKRLCLPCLTLIFIFSLLGCPNRTNRVANISAPPRTGLATLATPVNTPGRLIHVLVALCDNRFQGIVPVPARIGNGDDPANNLYWGAAYGVKSYFQKSKDWKLIAERRASPPVLERVVFKHTSSDVYLVADAYQGRLIQRCTIDFLQFAAGARREAVDVRSSSKQVVLNAGSGADLVVYVGHDGLMDFTLSEYPQRADERQRDVMILACASKPYFREAIRKTGARPLLWTTGLMAPEAYVLQSAIGAWIAGASGNEVRRRAAQSYNSYQRCGMKAALNLFSSEW